MVTNQVQFSSHAIERLLGRMSNVVTYAEVQTLLSNVSVRTGDQHIPVKRLSKPIEIADPTAYNGKVRGDKIFALCTVRNGNEVNVDTIALRF